MSKTIGTIRKAGVVLFLCASIAAVSAANPRAEELYQTAVINHEKNPDLALSAINAAVKLDPTIFKYQKERGTILLESDDYSEAIKSLDTARKMNDKDPDLLCTRAECLRYLKRWQEALADMHEAIKLTPKPTASLFQHEARLYLHMEQFGPADAAIKKCLKFDQNNLTAQFDEMKILQSWKKWKELTEFITICLKQKPMRHSDEMEFPLQACKRICGTKRLRQSDR